MQYLIFQMQQIDIFASYTINDHLYTLISMCTDCVCVTFENFRDFVITRNRFCPRRLSHYAESEWKSRLIRHRQKTAMDRLSEWWTNGLKKWRKGECIGHCNRSSASCIQWIMCNFVSKNEMVLNHWIFGSPWQRFSDWRLKPWQVVIDNKLPKITVNDASCHRNKTRVSSLKSVCDVNRRFNGSYFYIHIHTHAQFNGFQ